MNCCGTTVNDDFGDIEAFYPIKPDCREDVPQTRFKPKVGC